MADVKTTPAPSKVPATSASLTKAHRLRDGGKLEAAAVKYQAVLDADGDGGHGPEAMYNLATLLSVTAYNPDMAQRLGNTPRALELFRRAAALPAGRTGADGAWVRTVGVVSGLGAAYLATPPT
jgi:hypothetical protein